MSLRQNTLAVEIYDFTGIKTKKMNASLEIENYSESKEMR